MAARSGLTISRDISLNSLTVTKLFVVPVVPNLSVITSTSIGSLVYNLSTGGLSIFGVNGWVPVDAQTSNLSLSPLATGESIVASGTGPNITVKGISVGGTLSVFDAGTQLVLSTPSSTYVAGTDISIASGIISNTAPQIQYTASGGVNLTGTTFSNTGVLSVSANPNNTLTLSGTAADPVLSANYQAGTNITIVGNTISNMAGPPNVLSLTAANNTLTVNNASPSNPVVSGNYVGGNGIGIVGNVISNNAVSTITAGNSTIIIGGSATVPTVVGNYTAGSNISIVGNVISLSVVAVTSVTAANSTILIGGTSVAPTVSGNLQAGTNITISGGNTINKVPFITNLTAADTTVVVGGTATAKTIQGNYVAGTGMTIVGNTITYNSGVDNVTSPNSTAVIGGTALNPTVRCNYVAGTNINITGNVISQPGVPVSADIVYFCPFATMSGVASHAFVEHSSQINSFVIPGVGSYSALPYYLDMMTVTCNNPHRNSGLSVVVTLNVNYNYHPDNTPSITLSDEESVVNDSGPGLYIPAGSLVTPAINSQPANTLIISFRRTYISTTSIPIPPNVSLVSVAVGLNGFTSFTVTAPSGLNANVVCGCRIAIVAGVTPPATWTAPADCRISEIAFNNALNTITYLATGTLYSYSAWFINANTPVTMSASAYTGSFTPL